MKYRNFIIIPVIVLGVIACQKVTKTPKPDNLIPENKMVNILVDLLKVDGTINFSHNLYTQRDVEARTLIFEKYDIDSLQLAKSNAYYAEDYVVIHRIFDSVQQRLTREKNLVDSLMTKEMDSLKMQKKNISEEEARQKPIPKKSSSTIKPFVSKVSKKKAGKQSN